MQDVQTIQIDLLRQQIARLEGSVVPCQGIGNRESRGTRLPSGCPALDAILPEKGFRPGTLVEWLAYDEANCTGPLSTGPLSTGAGAATLAFLAAAQALGRSESSGNPGAVMVLDPWGEFYPPAAVRWGIDPSRLIVVHPGNLADYHWAFDQSLRSTTVAAAVAWPDAARKFEAQAKLGQAKLQPRLSSRNQTALDGHTFRRWQLAAEAGQGLGLMIRPVRVRHEPSWADVRILVEPLPSTTPHGASRRLRVTLLRCRGGMKERSVELEIPL